MRGLSIFFIFLFCLAMVSLTGADTNDLAWQDVSRGVRDLDLRAVAVSPGNAETIYITSFNTVYKTTNGGKSWEEVLSFRGTGNTVNSIAVNPLKTNVIYAGTEEGLYSSTDHGNSWKKIFSGVGDLKGSVFSIAVSPANSEVIFIGTKSGIFWTQNSGADWKKGRNLPADSIVSSIGIDYAKPDIIYTVTERGLYKSTNSGADWTRILENFNEESSVEEYNISNQIENSEVSEISAGKAKLRSIAIAPQDTKILYLGTSKGLLVSSDSGLTWKTLSTSGLISRDIRHILITPSEPDNVYAATSRGVFRYSKASESWKELYKGLTSVDIRFLASITNSPTTLWAVTKKGVFKTYAMTSSMTESKETEKSEVISAFDNEPAIEEIQKAAIRYAEVHPEKIEGWRKAAAKKAWLPDLSLGYNKGRDWQSSKYYSSGTYWGDDVTRGRDYDWSVSFTWELGDLVWNDDQTSIDTRSRLMVQLRDDVLNEVTRLYFERRRLQMEMLLSPPKDIKDKLEKDLRFQELTADIDALTDFYFSKRLRQEEYRRQ
ncbi:MAG: hypothetical protein HZC11_09205 [Nitrospirae bacterium]|nr:hypothetical protein [Nitrospirota bacterium]